VNNKTTKDQYIQIQGEIAGLMQQLKQCAPHPEQKDKLRPLFAANHDAFVPNDPNGGMLGTMMMESILGGVFNEVANDNGISTAAIYMDFDKIGEVMSEYLTDQAESAAHGRGTYAIGAGKAISKGFNGSAQTSAQMQAFMRDLPARQDIEGRLADLARELDMLQAQDNQPAPQPMAA